jgi:hypothetical protein
MNTENDGKRKNEIDDREDNEYLPVSTHSLYQMDDGCLEGPREENAMQNNCRHHTLSTKWLLLETRPQSRSVGARKSFFAWTSKMFEYSRIIPL